MLEICIQSGNWYQEEDPDVSLRLARECGFEGIDYNIDQFLPGGVINNGTLTTFFDQSVEELLNYYRPMKEACQRHQIKVAQMHAPFPLHVEGKEDVNDYLIMAVDKVCAISSYLDCPAVVVHPFLHPDKETEKEINLQMYRRMIPSAQKYHVTLCLENMFGSFHGHLIEGPCSTAEETVWYLDTLNQEAGETLFGYCLDIGHANLLGRNINKYIKTLGKDHLTILHIHDNPGTADSHMIPYTQAHGGTCYTDWDGMLDGLKAIGYTGPLAFETFLGIDSLPDMVKPDGMKLVSSIGRYFRTRLQE